MTINKLEYDNQLGNVTGTIPIVFATDEGYVPYTLTSLESIMRTKKNHNPYDIIILIDPSFSEESRNQFIALVENDEQFQVRFIEVADLFDDIPIRTKHITTPTFYRLLLPELLEEYDKCIYIDGDTIVCEDLSELYSMELGAHYIAGVRAYGYFENVEKHKNRLELSSFDLYVNAGVLLMNLGVMREENWMDHAMGLIPKQFSDQDQDIINVSCFEKILELPYRYNMMTKYWDWTKERFDIIGVDYDEIVDGRNHPIIIHYADKIKPWNDFRASNSPKWWESASIGAFWEQIVKDKVICETEDLQKQKAELTQANNEIRKKKDALQEKDRTIASKNKTIDDKIKEIKDLENSLVNKKKELELKKHALEQNEKALENKMRDLEVCSQRLAKEKERCEHYKKEIEDIHTSFTFKSGRFITYVPRKLREHLK